ncbi:MAG: ATP-dependent Clp protease proteolytic subunit [Firmicutes bacterium]|nr:ATP-dependent Clp protease proteolytic subunit [Bacillota bacterium]
MYVQVKSSNGINTMPVETRLLSQRRIFLEGEIDQKMACSIARQMMTLMEEDRRTPIDIYINSPGGSVDAGLLIYDLIHTCDTPVRMYCLGCAGSMAAVLFASGEHGRYMMPHSELMLHEPGLGNLVTGNSTSLKSISYGLQEIKEQINFLLVKHTGRTKEEIDEATSYDHYFSAEESVDFGLCDHIVGFAEMIGG